VIVGRHLAELVALSVLLAALWRAEVEWHGWAGLTWISYPHLAVPLGAALFLAWVAQTRIVRATGRRWGLLGLALPYAATTLLGYAMLLRMGLQTWGVPPALLVALGLVFAWPLVAFGIGRITGHPLSWRLLAPSSLLVWAHLPLGSLVAGDAIHAVKTGAAVVPMVIGLGLPWTTRPPPSVDRRPAGPPEGSPGRGTVLAEPSDEEPTEVATPRRT